MYKVVLVDDENRITRGLSHIIAWERLNCTVVGTAYNGETGLRLVEDTQPDIVITDINMPYMNGLEMIEALKARSSPIKFIILSGYNDFQYAQKGIRLGIKNFILKPVNEQELEESIQLITFEIENERLNRELLLQSQLQNQKKATISEQGLIHNIKNYIELHYMENISLNSIAEHFFINPSYLSQLFKKKTKDTFLNYLTDVRIEKSKKLLLETDLKVYEISDRVGYKDAKYFSKIFEKKTLIKPSDYKSGQG